MKKIAVVLCSLLLIAAGTYSQSAATYNALLWRAVDRLTLANTANAALYCTYASNLSVSGGFLNITGNTSATTCPGNPPQYGPVSKTFSGGELAMRNFSFMYGAGATVRVDSRIKYPAQQHASIWMVGAGGGPTACQQSLWLWQSNSACPGWPNPANEVDISETCPSVYTGAPTTTLRQNVDGDNAVFNITTTVVSDFTQNFHTYSIQWSAGNINFLVDNVQTNAIASNVPHLPMYILLFSAPGDACSSPSGFSSSVMQVDYVRVCTGSSACTVGTSNMLFDDEFNGASTAPAFLQ